MMVRNGLRFGIGWLIGKSCATKPFPGMAVRAGMGIQIVLPKPASGCLESMRCRCFLGADGLLPPGLLLRVTLPRLRQPEH